ncbi:MAG: hypothetical protein K2F66_02660 [Duncaniella sp.]|nr:hypothetical protein [Duncaniella sp.]
MADNYLEKRMEEYRSGRLAVRSRTSSSMRAPRRNDSLTLRYEPMTVAVIADVMHPVVAETIGAFTAVGCRVAFMAADVRVGNAVAQRTAARYYPASLGIEGMLADMISHWGGSPEVAVSFMPSSSPVCVASRWIDASRWLTDLPAPSVLARHILYLAHPDNAFLLG